MSNSKEALSNLFSYHLFVHATSGSCASLVAVAAVYPFLTILQRKQLDDLKAVRHLNSFELIYYLFKKEGLGSIYRGLIPVMQSSCISNFVYFYVFHLLKSFKTRDAQSAGSDLILGTLAGCINVLTTTPLWCVNTRLRMNNINYSLPYDNLISGLKYIAKNEGIEKLWAGTQASLLLSINPAIQFSVYESIKRYLTKLYGQEKPSVFYFFFLGALSKVISTCITYPLQLVQTKMRYGDKNNTNEMGTMELLLQIIKTNGFKGLYVGMEAKFLQTILTAALMFLAYEKIARFVKILLRASAASTT
ncbi:hypothetical protein PVAND_010089 [Polypedilum vanderplanki]|uniref:Mitochondrial carrier protein n=1 Tax=Polypedilum vanderplanki TaxID=319348 RepID=A0A9J6CEI3_POLVA|nr:hypothetical protein PVAND_010089 [Polypedilum vanderplanki]